jgi:predicted nucleic acid-binding protein
MLIVLDTNVLQEDFLMASGRFRVLLDYAERTQATFVLPRIVVDELGANYRRELQKRLAAVTRAHEQLHGIHPASSPPTVALDIDAATTEYLARTCRRLRVRPSDVPDYAPRYLADVVRRAIDRRRPCSDKGEEIRDALLWLATLDAAAEASEPVFLISRNTAQFSADKSSLHPDLLAEAVGRGITVHYLPSVEEFARQHATRIAFITDEWLSNQIASDEVFDGVRDEIVDAARRTLLLRWQSYEHDYSVEGGGVSIDEYFVNVLADGDMLVEIHWYGHATVEFTEYSEDGGYRQDIDLTVRITTEATVRDQAVVGWTQVDSNID